MTAQDRELWDALVFDAHDHPMADAGAHDSWNQSLPLDQRHTLVMDRAQATSFRICIQSADESHTGERLQRYADSNWWRWQVQRFTNYRWAGDIQVATCTGEPPPGWVYVREGRDGEVDDSALAHAKSQRLPLDPHGVESGWIRSEIVWHSADKVRDTEEEEFEEVLAHELGHVLGFFHTPWGSGFVMDPVADPWPTWPDTERWLAQWAYAVGPGVRYPGLFRPGGSEPPGPGSLGDGVEDLVDEALEDLQDDSAGRSAAEPVPALPVAGLWLLVALLGLLGWRRLRAM